MGSPAERFRNELSQRLCTDAFFSLPNANLLVGVLIDAMEYNLTTRYHPLARATLHNVLKLSNEVECLGKMLQLNIRVRHRSLDGLHPFTLQALYMLSLPAASLLNPGPEVITLMTYVAVVDQLSTYIGPRAIYDLIGDFNRTIPRKFGSDPVKRVPGVGPRIIRQSGACDRLMQSRLGWMGDLGDLSYMACAVYRSPSASYKGKPTSSHGVARSLSCRPLGAHLHVPRHTRSWDTAERENSVAPPTHQLLGYMNQPASSGCTYMVDRPCPEYSKKISALAPALAPSLTSTSNLLSAPVDTPDLSRPSRASSPYPYLIVEEPITNELHDRVLESSCGATSLAPENIRS